MKKLLGLILSLIMATAVQADNTLRIVSNFPVGSGPDNLSRKVAEQLSSTLKVPVIIDNKPGGNGTVAFNAALNSPSNNTLLYASNDSLVVYPALTNNYQLINQFRPLKEAVKSELVLAVGSSVSSIADLKKINKINYGSWGIGSASHILGAELSQALGLENSVHVPYKDYGQWFADVSTGTLSFSFVTIASTQNLEKAGRIKYLAVVGDSRHPKYPDVPTLNELIKKRLYAVGWVGWYVRADMSRNQEQQLADALSQVMKTKEIQETLANLNYTFNDQTPREFSQMVQQEQKKLKTDLLQYKIKID